MQLAVIGVPFGLDQLRHNMGRAPETLRDAGMLDMLASLGVDATFMLLDEPLPDGTFEARMGALLARIAGEVRAARVRGALPLIIGGDCVTSLGTLAGMGNSANTGIAWADAHGDFNTPQISVSGYLGGMPLACAVGRGLDELRLAAGLHEPIQEKHVVLLGVRDLDEAEKAALQDSEVTMLSGMEVAQRNSNIDGAFGLLRTLDQVYLHLDIDVLDNTVAPGISYPAPGGLTLEQLQELARGIVQGGNVHAIALTAVNPEHDVDGRTVRAALALLETTIGEMVNV